MRVFFFFFKPILPSDFACLLSTDEVRGVYFWRRPCICPSILSVHPHFLPKVSKVKYLNFVITKAVVDIFAEILHAGRAAIDTKRIKGDLSLNVWVRSPRVDLGGGT